MDARPASSDPKPVASICTFGDLLLDVIVLPHHQLTPDGDTPARIQLAAGGQAANVAAWASVLGVRSRLICARGTDFASDLATAEVRRYGVEITGPVRPGRGGVVVSIREALGQRTMASDRGVAPLLDPSEVDPRWVESADVLHVSGYALLREPMAEAAVEAARHARRVSVDLASARDIELLGAKEFTARLEALRPEIAFATDAERAAVPDFDTTWVIKLGARGARFPDGHRSAPPVTPVDTTGAGDALAAGYLIGGPERAIEAAARSLGTSGGMPSNPIEL